jgi:hypothetical protein
MRTRTTHDIPARLAAIRRRFHRWRLTRRGRSRIPEQLWALAVKVAGQYGLNPTAQALGLDYYSLKKHIEAARRGPPGRTAPSRRGPEGQTLSGAVPAGRQGRHRPWREGSAAEGRPAVATFLELAPPASGGGPECTLELEDPGGAKMRVHLQGVPAPDLTALSRSFWGVDVRHGESRQRRT